MENLFFMRFLVSSFILSGLTLMIIGIKKIFKNHISERWQYKIWMIFLVMLMIPFTPQEFCAFGRGQVWNFSDIEKNSKIVSQLEGVSQEGKQLLNKENGLQDLAISVDQSIMTYLNNLLINIWIIGAIVWAVITIWCNYGIKRIKSSRKAIRNKEVEALFEKCKRELKIKRNILLGESELIQSPMIFGLGKTYILLPAQMIDLLEIEDIHYILLHELTHYKNKDVYINYVMGMLQVIYWFNPLVYQAFKIMRTDREVACDISVLKKLDESQYIEYGMTLINFAEMVSGSTKLSMVTSMGGTKKQIKTRIEKIAHFKKETKKIQVKSLLIFVLIGMLTFSQAPVLSIVAYERNQYDFEGEKVIYEDLASYFEGVEGSFVLYDTQANQYSIYNQSKSEKRVAPNSTYKIYSALIGLEEGVIQVPDSTLTWNGERHSHESWNQNQDLYSAMKNSVNWYFQKLDQAVGKEKLQVYFDQIEYGNSNLSSGIKDYWIESSLRISPVEQVELLKAFYLNEMIFDEDHVNFVKETLKIAKQDEAILSGKTGTGIIKDKSVNGWFIGYVERTGRTYIFATNIEGKDNASGTLAAEITLSILKDKQIY